MLRTRVLRQAPMSAPLKSGGVAASAPPLAPSPYTPVCIRGRPFFDPIRTTLTQTAQRHAIKNPLWLLRTQCETRGFPLRADAPSTTTVVLSSKETVAFVNASDVTLPHNVDARCLLHDALTFDGASGKYGAPMRSILGGRFSHSISSQLKAVATARKLMSSAWLSAEEAAFLGWTFRDGAEPVSVTASVAPWPQRARRSGAQNSDDEGTTTTTASPGTPGTQEWYNSEDVVDAINFDDFFSVDRRMYNVSSGYAVPPLLTLQWQTFLGFLGLNTMSGAADVRFGGTLADLNAGKLGGGARDASEVTVLPDIPAFTTLRGRGSSELLQLFVAAQTSNPAAVVARGHAARASRMSYFDNCRK